jgi:hypothetical protein
MSLATTAQDGTVIVAGYTDWTAWIQQLENRLSSQRVWDLADQTKIRQPRTEPIPPNEPDMEMYQKRNNFGND